MTGVDPSGGMLELARDAARERLPRGHADRYLTETGWADELPFEDGAFDLAVSSFVLQLVPDRGARCARSGACSGQRGRSPGSPGSGPSAVRADRIANEVLDEAGFDPPEQGGRNGDVASAGRRRPPMRRAGFRDVARPQDELVHSWDPASYLAFLTEFDEESLFGELGPRERRRSRRGSAADWGA